MFFIDMFLYPFVTRAMFDVVIFVYLELSLLLIAPPLPQIDIIGAM